MNITVIGASAGVGLETVNRALQRGHSVTTLSRSAIALPHQDKLKVVQGSATDKDDLKKVIAGADAIIVALGTGKNLKATTLYTDAAKTMIDVQKEIGITIPFIVLTGFGAGESGKYHRNIIMKFFFRFLLNKVYDNKTAMEEMIAASTINWMMVRPGVLTNKPLSENYRMETVYRKGMNIGSIARKDVADFMVKQAEQPVYLKQYVALSNK